MSEVFRISGRRPLFAATFLSRPNRFLVECLLDGEKIQAFLPNPGRLWELLFSGSTLFLQKEVSSNSARKTRFTVIGIQSDHGPVMLHTHKTNDLAEWLFDHGLVPGMEDYRVIRREVPWGKSRFDLLVSDGSSEMILEIKSCSLFGRRIAMFPDAPSLRAVKHVKDLQGLAAKGKKTGVIFIVQSGDPEFFIPDFHTDYDFAEALFQIDEGEGAFEVKAFKIPWNEDFSFCGKPREIPILWDVLSSEASPFGYVLLLCQFNKRKEYAIVISPRLEYVDYNDMRRPNMIPSLKAFLSMADSIRSIPVRTGQDLEAVLANGLGSICDTIKYFNGKPIFMFQENPLSKRSFIQYLLSVRIDRLEEFLSV